MRFRFWVYISAGLFAAGMALGFIVSIFMPESIVGVLSGEMAELEQLSEMLEPFGAFTAVFIFLKNLSVLLLGFLFSPLLCLLPVMTLVFNGTLLSFIATLVARETSLGMVLVAILPHGIFEIPAIIIGEAAALSIGVALISALLNPIKRDKLEHDLKRSLRYLLVAALLLVPAAVVETFVTPLLMQRVAS